GKNFCFKLNFNYKISSMPLDLKEFCSARVLITVGIGFIGSALARRLVEMGAKVTLIDSLIPQYGGNLFNIHDFKDKVTVNIADVRDPYAMSHWVRGLDFLFNL